MSRHRSDVRSPCIFRFGAWIFLHPDDVDDDDDDDDEKCTRPSDAEIKDWGPRA